MKQVRLIQEHHPRLLLFFAGWGADQTPFQSYRPQGCDFMICYDYRTLNFDVTGLSAYREIHAIGWSMGVWAASQLLTQLNIPITSSTAINGTPFPIDETRGISPAIFQGTLDNLNDVSLHKFLRRMCADKEAFRAFLQVTPRRPLEELREELSCIKKQYQANRPCTFHWTKAIVGRNDRIIPPANQQRAWDELQTPTLITADAHYQTSLFNLYLQEQWH